MDETRLFFPGLAGLYRCLSPLGYALARFAVGATIFPHGFEKVFQGGVYRIAEGNILKLGLSPPLAWAWLVAVVECFGTAMLAFGLFTRPVALALAIEMTVIVFGIHFANGYAWTSRGFEYPMLLGLLCFAFVLGGGGKYSLDRLIGREF
jgi:putative oxidoreductase